MASRYFAIELGDEAYEVAEGDSTQSKTVEVAVNLDDAASRSDVIAALEKIKDHMLRGIWPPA